MEETKKFYETTDIYIAAILNLLGNDVSTYKNSKIQTVFVFEDTEKRKIDFGNYFNRKLKNPPQPLEYRDAVARMKTLTRN